MESFAEVTKMAYRFNPPPGWQVPEGFTPPEEWRPDPVWPAAPEGWEFWVEEPHSPPSQASQKLGGLLKSLKNKAADDDWMGKAKAAATQATTAAQQAAGQASEMAKQRDQAAVAKAGPLPEGALWRGVSHESGRNSIVTLYPDRIERTKPTSRMSLTGMLTGGPEDLEVIPTKSVSSVQVRRGSWYHDVTVYASGNTIVLSVDAADAEKLRGLIMDQILGGSRAAPADPPVAEPVQPSGAGIIEQIKQLGELRDAGLVTPEEFEAKKAELLSRL